MSQGGQPGLQSHGITSHQQQPHASHFPSILPQSLTVGDEIRVKCKDGDVYQGSVFAYDKKFDTLVLEEPDKQNPGNKNVRIVTIHMLQDMEILKSNPNGHHKPIDKIQQLDLETVKKREAAGLAQAEKEFARIGKNVTPHAQTLFDQLSKTYSVSWNGKVIESKQLQLSISPPYRPEDCKGSDEASLERIKQVVKSIADKQPPASTTTNDN